MILSSGNVLTKVTQYRLQRPSGTIRIEVYQSIVGSDEKFVAAPVDVFGGATSTQDLQVRGNTEMDALENLIGKIQSLPSEDIFPRKK